MRYIYPQPAPCERETTMRDDFDPSPGAPETLVPGLRRILAPNPSAMTYRGTNTYLLGETDLAVIDPGPRDAAHLEAILHAVSKGQRITHILVSHAHLDHSPLAQALARETGAPVLAYGNAAAGRSAIMSALAAAGADRSGEGVDHAFIPDRTIADGERIDGAGWSLTALWTPGHFGNHLCFQWGSHVFSGDLVMGWASSLISPPDGDLSDFMASCRRLRALGPAVLHPGHGAPVTEATARIDWLIAHRQSREAEVFTALSHGPASAPELAARIHTDTPPQLLPAATRNVLAHLIDLAGRNRVRCDDPLHENARFSAVPDTA